MKYSVVYTEKALKSLEKIDKGSLKLIKNWIENNLIGTDNPRQHGKGLTGNLSKRWRYRIGDYRIIADIQDDKIVIVIVDVGHRRDIYKKR